MIALLGAGPHVLTIHGLDTAAIEDRLRRGLYIQDTPANRSRGVVSRLDTALARASALPVPRAAVVTCPLVRAPDGDILSPAFAREARGPAVDGRLSRAHQITAYVVTLGHAWDAALDRLCAQDEAAGAWFLDQVANAWVDEAAREVERLVAADQARLGLERTRRIRAGYAGHPSIELQAALCLATGAERLAVAVLDSGTVTPGKTVTGIVGWEVAR